MKKVTAVMSMLHEPSGGPNSATRLFRSEPVLAWTLKRLWRASHISTATVLCWDDQLAGVEPVAEEHKAYVSVRTPRLPMPQIDALAAARRWGDGWRGGLLGSCEFDRGFYGPWIDEIRLRTCADAILLIDPAAGLVDPVLIENLLAHSERNPEVELCFSQAAPGLSGAVLSATLVERLGKTKIHPGALLSYQPDAARRDPIATEACVAVPAGIARTLHRFTLDSQRQIEKVSAVTEGLNGQLMGTEAEGLLAAFDRQSQPQPMPREVVIELNTMRSTSPLYWPGERLNISRPAMDREKARQIFAELAELDDTRVIFAGIGDPLLHDEVLEFARLARSLGINALAMETDLLGVGNAQIAELADSQFDIISVHLPALSKETYRQIMGVDALADVVGNIKHFVEKRSAYGRGVPLLVPTFIKCRQNLAEMEPWYDQWLRTLNCAVISGPSDYAGAIDDIGVADMRPPRRGACARLSTRMTIHSDGLIVSCEEDVTGKQGLGHVGSVSMRKAWDACTELRMQHQAAKWDQSPICKSCVQWHRP